MSTTIEKIGKVGVLDHLDELERLMREYLADIGGSDDLNVRLTLSSFIAWLRQRQRESVAEGYGHFHGKSRLTPME